MGSFDTLTLPLVLITALIDSINPCAIGVLIFLISALLVLSHDRKRMVISGAIYIAAVYVTYFLAGLGLIWFVQAWNITDEIGILVGILVIFLGLVEIKDFFGAKWGMSLSINPKYIERIKNLSQRATIPGLIVLGFFVAAVELPCTGGPYLAITAYLAKHPLNIGALLYLALYNFIFVLPLLLILAAVFFGARLVAIQDWKQNFKRWMLLAAGLLMIGLGVLLILFSTGIIYI